MRAIGINTGTEYAQAPTKAECFAKLNQKYPFKTGENKRPQTGKANRLYPEPITIIREDRAIEESRRLIGLKAIAHIPGCTSFGEVS